MSKTVDLCIQEYDLRILSLYRHDLMQSFEDSQIRGYERKIIRRVLDSIDQQLNIGGNDCSSDKLRKSRKIIDFSEVKRRGVQNKCKARIC